MLMVQSGIACDAIMVLPGRQVGLRITFVSIPTLSIDRLASVSLSTALPIFTAVAPEPDFPWPNL